MFLSVCSPASSKTMSSFPWTSSHTRPDTQTPRFRNAFQPCGHVHAIPEDIATVNHNVTEVDADAELDPLLLRTSVLRWVIPR